MKPPTISTVSSTSQGRRSQGVFCLNVFYFSGPLDTNTLLTLLTPWKRSTEQVSFNTPATMTEIFFEVELNLCILLSLTFNSLILYVFQCSIMIKVIMTT